MTTKTAIHQLKLAAQRGFSNVQIAIGILVGVIILLGSLGGYQYIMQAKVNNEILALGDLRASTIRYGQFVGAFNAANVTLATLNGQNFFNGAGGLVATGVGATTAVTNQYGGAVTVANAGGSGIAFTFNGVPNRACLDVAGRVDNVASTVTINTVASKVAGAASVAATVAARCIVPTVADQNAIIYTLTQ